MNRSVLRHLKKNVILFTTRNVCKDALKGSPNPRANSVVNDIIPSKAFPTWDAKTRPCILEEEGKPFSFLPGVKQTAVEGR